MPKEMEHLYGPDGELDPDKMYDEYNRLYFNGSLPKWPVKWSRTKAKDCRGLCDYKDQTVYLNPKFKTWERIWCEVLLHELVHVEQRFDVRSKDHGYKFDRRMRRLVRQGAFHDLW